MHNNKKEMDGAWKDGSFASITKEYINCIHSGEHSVTARDVCHTYLRCKVKKPHNVTPKAFKPYLEVLFKFYDNFNADYALKNGEK